ncbi:MAG: hypothetical protein WBA57_25720 [Elainellaceae cyanobacterium]
MPVTALTSWLIAFEVQNISCLLVLKLLRDRRLGGDRTKAEFA